MSLSQLVYTKIAKNNDSCSRTTLSITPQAEGVPTQVIININEDDFEKKANIRQQTEVAQFGTVTVTLVSNASMGFQWSEQAQITDATVLHQIGHQYITSAATTPPTVGASSKEEWTFKPLGGPGVITFSMDYSRTWPGGEKAVRTFKLTVSVVMAGSSGLRPTSSHAS